jgi:hypothetical protein|tara:strand:+ start:37 stop:822 length:786 start_codon:yes stop_codon:yes gene_type:complete
MSICNNQLLQVKLDNEYIQNWTPLECVDKNPRNCGASALALAKIIPKDLAQLISRDTEISGINEMKMLEIINKQNTLEAKYGLIHSDISNVQEIFNELEPGNGTVVLFIRPDGSGHIVILAKDANNIEYVLEAQYLQTYTESSISQYIASELYNSFFIFCNTIAANKRLFYTIFQSILGKRKLDNLDVVDTNTKKPRRNTPSNNNKMDLVTDNNDMMDVVTNDNDNTVTGSGKKSKKARTKSKKGKKGKNSRKNTKYKNIA